MAGDTPIETSVRVYTDGTAAVFAMRFPNGASGMNTTYSRGTVLPKASPSSAFPDFVGSAGRLPQLGYLSWRGTMCPATSTTGQLYAHVQDEGEDNGPVVLFSEFNRATLVLSPLNNFMTAQHTATAQSLVFGVGGEVESVPVNFTQEVLVALDVGITPALMHWGSLIRRFHQAPVKLPDSSLRQLGYWTDNVRPEE